MKFMDRVRVALGVMAGGLDWNWRRGTKPGHMFDGSKFRGSSVYPSAWDADHETLRNKSRIAYWDSSQAQAMLGRLVDNVVGTGLALEASPIWKLVGDQGLNDEQRHELSREIELRFHLWANSHEPDAAGKHTLYELQAIEFLNRLRDGETFHILRYSGSSDRMSPLSIQTLLPEQVQSPTDPVVVEAAKASGRRIVDGVEIDAYGRELAIHVADDLGLATKTTKIPVSGVERRFVLHPVSSDTLGAVRGTPILANCVHELQKITDLTVAELEAALINAILAVWIKPSKDAAASRALTGVTKRGSSAPAQESGDTPQATFDKPGLIVQTLKAGEELESFDTKRPNVNAVEFIRQITRMLAASKGIPIEVLEESFNANYSASRASLLLFWRKVEIERAKTVSQFLGPIYEAWFREEVKAGNISAPNFSTSPVIARAWLNSSWNGDKQPSIDPLKEANADGVRIAQGVTTRERVAMEYNGTDAMENIARLKEENIALAEANQPLQPAAVIPAEDESDT